MTNKKQCKKRPKVRTDMINDCVMDDATIMNKENRSQFCDHICEYVSEKWPAANGKCYIKNLDAIDIPGMNPLYVELNDHLLSYRDGVSWGVMKQHLAHIYETHMILGCQICNRH